MSWACAELARFLDLVEDGLYFLVLLAMIANGAALVEDKLQDLGAASRRAGKSSTQIGQALGITKQAAWERFSGDD